MNKLEKVIKGLETCLKYDLTGAECENCPYHGECQTDAEPLMRDALALLKAQEPTDGDAISRSALLAAYDAAHKGPPGGARKLIEEAPPIVSMAPAPRLMSLYEVAKMAADYHDCMLWFEPKEIDDEMWFMAYAQPVESDETDIHIYEFGNDVPIEAKKYLYGQTWRCWTSRPTDAQREAVKWDE